MYHRSGDIKYNKIDIKDIKNNDKGISINGEVLPSLRFVNAIVLIADIMDITRKCLKTYLGFPD